MKIAIVDDHKLLLEGLQAQIEKIPGVSRVSCFSNPANFLNDIEKSWYDIVFLDIHFEHTNGFEILKQLKMKAFQGKVIMLSGNVSAYSLNKSIREGASGFIGKDAENEEIGIAIDKVNKGDFYIGRTLAEFAGELLTTKRKDLLSERETEIVTLIAQGLSYKQIGEKLFISPRTVEAHRNHILEKLQLENVTELIRFALKNHLI